MIEIYTYYGYPYSKREEIISKFKEKANTLIEETAHSGFGKALFYYKITTDVSNTTIKDNFMYYCGELVYETNKERKII